MSSRFDELPIALAGEIDVGEPNTAVKLYEGALHISSDKGHSLAGRGSVQLTWLPSPRLQFSIQGEDVFDKGFTIFGNKLTVNLPEKGMSFEAFGSRLDMNSLTGIATGEIENNFDKSIYRIMFYVPNLTDMGNEPIRDAGRRNARVDRLHFSFDNWQIIIENLPNKKPYMRL